MTRGFIKFQICVTSLMNDLLQSISSQHTTATITHWTGRPVCSASTQEWAIRKFLYNYTDVAAVTIVGKVIGKQSSWPRAPKKQNESAEK